MTTGLLLKKFTSEISRLPSMKLSNAVDFPLWRSFLCNISCTTVLQHLRIQNLNHWNLSIEESWQTYLYTTSELEGAALAYLSLRQRLKGLCRGLFASRAANSTTWTQQTKRDRKMHLLPGLRAQLWISLHSLNSDISVTMKLLTTMHKSWGTKSNFLYLVAQTFQSPTIFWFCIPCIFREQTIFTSSKA